jgi:antirestriction protein ArdC
MPRFVTFKQAQETGGSVRKGEHGTKVYFVKQLRVKEGEAERSYGSNVPVGKFVRYATPTKKDRRN